MATSYYERSAWTSVGPVRALTRLEPGEVLGVAVHWPGGGPLGYRPALQQTVRSLQGIRAFHAGPEPKGRGWSDIAYQACGDQAGRVFRLRGEHNRSAANGNQTLNRAWGAFLFLVGPGEAPTQDLLAAFTDWRTQVWLQAYPHATRVVGHGDLHQSDCPGPIVSDLIRAGRLATPTTTGGDEDMSANDVGLTGEAIKQVAKQVAEACTGAGALHPVLVPVGEGERTLPDGREVVAPATAWSRTLTLLTQQAAAISDLTALVTSLRDEVRSAVAR